MNFKDLFLLILKQKFWKNTAGKLLAASAGEKQHAFIVTQLRVVRFGNGTQQLIGALRDVFVMQPNLIAFKTIL